MGNYSFLATISPFFIDVTDNEILVFEEVRVNVGENYDPLTGGYTAEFKCSLYENL